MGSARRWPGNADGAAAGEVPGLPLEQQVAERSTRTTRGYRGGHANSRVKDLVDVVLVKQFLGLDGGCLQAALVGTFEARCQQQLPARFPRPPADWAVPYRKLAREVGIDQDLVNGHGKAAATPTCGKAI